MTGDSFIAFFLFWGIWLLVPLMIDGVSIIMQLIGVWAAEWGKWRSGWMRVELKDYPRVSLVIPVYNGAHSLSKTIQSIRNQSYPKVQLEVIVVDNGSTDSTEQAFLAEWLDLEADRRALGSGDRLAFEIDREFDLGIPLGMGHQAPNPVFGEHDRQHAVLEAVAIKNVGETGRDQTADAEIE